MAHNHPSTELSRRRFLKLSAISVAALSALSLTASLSGCSSEQAGSGFMVLRTADVGLLSIFYRCSTKALTVQAQPYTQILNCTAPCTPLTIIWLTFHQRCVNSRYSCSTF